MAWPDWIEELKQRYLADESNVFVMHGAVTGAHYLVDDDGDEWLDAVGVLKRFLARSRPIVGVLRPWPPPSQLQFAGLADRSRFENLVKAHDLLEGRTDALRETHALEALGRMWRAMSTVGTDQAYIVTHSERLLPSHSSRRVRVPGAPDLTQWPHDEQLRRSNNLLVFLTPEDRLLRSAFRRSCAIVHVSGEPEEEPEPDPLYELPEPEPEPEPAPVEEPQDTPVGVSSPPEPELRVDVDEVRRGLESALVRTLLAHPPAHRAARLPVMDAVAQVISHHRPAVWGHLTLELDEAQVRARGTGGERFLGAWRSDIALDAAAGMLLSRLEGTYTEQTPPPLDPTALTALAKRVVRLIGRLTR